MKFNVFDIFALIKFLTLGVTGDDDGGSKENDDEGGENKGEEGGEGGQGGNKPTDSEAKLLKEVMAKKRALQDTQTKLNELQEKLKEFEGIDPVKVKALLAEQESLEQKKLEQQGAWDKLKEQMANSHKQEITKFTQENDSLRQQLSEKETTISELTVGNAFAASTFIRDELVLTPNKARQVYGAHFAFEDGKVVAYDKPVGKSDRTLLVDSSGEPLNFEQALKKLVESDADKDHILKSKIKPGSGSNTNKKTTNPPKDDGKGDVKGRDRISGSLDDFFKK